MSEIISAAVLLILIMDPQCTCRSFMSVLKHTGSRKRRRAIAIRELLIIALLVMFIFLFAGEKILAFLNLRALMSCRFRWDYSVPDCD